MNQTLAQVSNKDDNIKVKNRLFGKNISIKIKYVEPLRDDSE